MVSHGVITPHHLHFHHGLFDITLLKGPRNVPHLYDKLYGNSGAWSQWTKYMYFVHSLIMLIRYLCLLRHANHKVWWRWNSIGRIPRSVCLMLCSSKVLRTFLALMPWRPDMLRKFKLKFWKRFHRRINLTKLTSMGTFWTWRSQSIYSLFETSPNKPDSVSMATKIQCNNVNVQFLTAIFQQHENITFHQALA
jgi:hypothetical protein